MKKRLQWKKAISTLLAVTMIGQSCLVTTADEVPVAPQTVESQQSDAAAKEAAAKAAEKAAAEAAAKAESEKAAAEAAAKAESEKAAAEAAAKAESEKAAVEAAAKAESEKAAAEAAAKTESEKAAAEAAAKTESEKAAAEAAAKAESEKTAAEAAAKAESEKAAAEAAAKAESEKAAADAAANAEAGKTDAAADKKDEKKDEKQDGAEKTITYRVTFAPQALDHGKIQVKGEEKPVEAVSSYYKEVEKNGSVVFTVTADDGYAVDHVMIEKTDLTKNAQGEYEITSIAKDTQIVVTYKELPKETADETTGEADKENAAPANDADQTGAEEQPEADADQQTKPAAPKHEEVSMHVGEDSWIVGEDGKDHSWDMLDNEVLSIVDKDGALVEVIGEAAGDVYLTHTYTAGEDVLMETFHVTVTEVEEAETATPEEETKAETETKSETETELTTESETELVTEAEVIAEAEAELTTESETEHITETETETELMSEAESEAETEESSMPAVVLAAVAGTTQVTLSAEEGVLPEGVTMTAVPVAPEEVAVALEEQAAAEGKTVVNITAVDITLYDAEGNEIQPQGKVTVSFVATNVNMQANSSAVFYVDESKTTAEKVADSDPEAGITQFDAEHFSIYVNAELADVGMMLAAEDYEKTFNIYVGREQTITGVTKNSRWEIVEGESYITLKEEINSGFGGKHKDAVIVGTAAGQAIVKETYSSWGSEYERYYRINVSAIEYLVTFLPNDGGTLSGSNNIITTDTGAISLPSPENVGITPKDNMEFAGWSTSKGGRGDVYTDGIEYTLTENVTLYAIWFDKTAEADEDKENTTAYFYIRADGEIQYEPANYGTNLYYPHGPNGESLKTLSGKLRSPVGVNNNLERVAANIAKEPSTADIKKVLNDAGVKFDPATQKIVWYVIKPRESNVWNVDGVIRDITKYELRYNPNGGSINVPGSNQYAEGQDVEVNYSKIPTRAGYIFLGWDENKNASTPTYIQGGVNNTITMPDHDVTLYAIWQPKDNVTLRYETVCENGATGQLSRTEEKLNPETGTAVGSMATAGANSIFMGWYSDQDCTTKLSDQEEYIPQKSEDAQWVNGTTYYAKFANNITSVSGTKTWVDGENPSRSEPGLTLYADGKAENGYTPTWTNKDSAVWTYTFSNLPKYDADTKQEIAYTVSETAVPEGYEKTVESENSFTNTKTTGSLTITKTVKAPAGSNITDSFSFTVAGEFGNAAVTDSTGKNYTVTDGSISVSVAAGSSVTLNLPTGNYTVAESGVADDGKVNVNDHVYIADSAKSATVTPGGNTPVEFVNTIADEKQITVIKTWKDQKNEYNKRPEKSAFAVTLTNQADATLTYAVTGNGWTEDTETDKWTGTVTVPAYDSNGNKLTYTVSESDTSNKLDAYTQSGPQSVIPADTPEVALANTLKTGTLVVNKTVAGLDDSKKGDDTFRFTAAVAAGNGTTAEFTLDPHEVKHNGNATWANIPAGEYTVTESVVESAQHAYTTSVAAADGTTGAPVTGSSVSYTVTVPENGTATVNYTNTAKTVTFDWAAASLNAKKVLTGRQYGGG